MSGEGGSKGKKFLTKGKENVKCNVCDKILRKDEMKKHWEHHHKDLGKTAQWKYLAEGTSDLSAFGFSSKKKKEVSEKLVEPGNEFKIAKEIVDEEGNIDMQSRKRRVEPPDDHDDSLKKLKISMSDDLQNFLEIKLDDLKAHVDSKIDSFIKTKALSGRDSESEKSVEDIANLVTHCTDIHELEAVFDTNGVGIKKELDVEENIDGYYCDICFDGTKPDFAQQSNGAFTFDKIKALELNSEAAKQSRELLNFKKSIKRHLVTKSHTQKLEILKTKEKVDKERMTREYKVGMNVWRERYEGIRQSKSRVCFENDILRAKLNGCDVGDTNHSREFAKKIDVSTYHVMKDNIKRNMMKPLDATERRRPAGLMMDKMTPNRRTGQMHAVVIPVPENPLGQDFLKPMMLEVPSMPNLSANGLASTAKEIFNDAGFLDDQLEGLGWDGEYVKKGVKNKILEILEVDMTMDEKADWVTEVWEPAHQLELATKDVKADDLFSWFSDIIQVLNDVTSLLGIGKGLEQSMEASKLVGEKFFKLRSLSDTRFSAYFEGSIANFVKRIETTIAALRMRTESTDKKVKDKAADLLKKICNKKFFLLIHGIQDLYRLLGSISSLLPTVQQFPWDIPKTQMKLLKQLKSMEKLQLSVNDETGEVDEVDQSLWPNLGKHLNKIMNDEYVSVQTAMGQGRRMGRSKGDISSSLSVLTSVENNLTSLVRNIVKHLELRLTASPTPKVIMEAGKCLDLEDIIITEESDTVKADREKSLKFLLKKAKYSM